jgi:hypothetical protein
MNGLRSTHQLPGWRSAPSPTPNRLPSKKFSVSMSRSSTPVTTPNWAANGSAVCWARSSGLAVTTVTSWPASDWAATAAICSPRVDSRNPGNRP